MWLNVVLWCIAAVWFLAALGMLRNILNIKHLPPPGHSPTKPSVSIIIPTRDEGSRIGQTVRNMLSQRDMEGEVIVVDDRSVDDTPGILAALAAENPHLRSVRIDSLPERWLGKVHAMHQGAAAATGDWLLFMDGDIWIGPDVVRRAVDAALAEGVEHICLVPKLSPVGARPPSILAYACLSAFETLLCDQLGRNNRDARFGYCGIGAFNLIRTDAWRKFGGLEPLRLEIVEDVKMGLLHRRNGGRTRGYFALKEVEADYAASVRGLIKALEKNQYAITGFRPWVVVLATAVSAGLYALPLIGVAMGRPAGWMGLMGLLSISIPAMVLARRMGTPLISALLTPICLPILLVSMWNSMLKTHAQGGVRWRDTFYPLEMLKEGRFR